MPVQPRRKVEMFLLYFSYSGKAKESSFSPGKDIKWKLMSTSNMLTECLPIFFSLHCMPGCWNRGRIWKLLVCSDSKVFISKQNEIVSLPVWKWYSAYKKCLPVLWQKPWEKKVQVQTKLLEQVDPLCGFLSKQTYCAGSCASKTPYFCPPLSSFTPLLTVFTGLWFQLAM